MTPGRELRVGNGWREIWMTGDAQLPLRPDVGKRDQGKADDERHHEGQCNSSQPVLDESPGTQSFEQHVREKARDRKEQAHAEYVQDEIQPGHGRAGGIVADGVVGLAETRPERNGGVQQRCPAAMHMRAARRASGNAATRSCADVSRVVAQSRAAALRLPALAPGSTRGSRPRPA